MCREVKVELELIPMDLDFIINPAENFADKARIDILSVRLCLESYTKKFVYICVFHPNVPFCTKIVREERKPPTILGSFKLRKVRLLLCAMVFKFNTFGEMGTECSRALQRAAGMLAEK